MTIGAAGVIRGALLAAAAGVALAGPARATVIAYDGFSYSAGSRLGGQGAAETWPAGGGKWTGGTQNVTMEAPGGDYNYRGLANAGNVLDFVGGSAPLFRTLGTTYDEGSNVFFVSFVEDVDSGQSKAYAGVSLFNTADSKQEKFFIGQDNLNGNWSMELSATGSRGVSKIPVTPEQAVLLVVELNFNTQIASLFVNPTSLGGSAPATADATLSLAGHSFSFNQIRIGAGAGENMDVDEFRLGQTYADVTPTEIVVPEPATWALALVGFASLAVAGLGGARRRTSAGRGATS